MSGIPETKVMRLRYAGTCAGCGRTLTAGDLAHYLRAAKDVRCLGCGSGQDGIFSSITELPEDPSVTTPNDHFPEPGIGALELTQGALPRRAVCVDCDRSLSRGSEAMFGSSTSGVLCLDCIGLDTAYSLGVPGSGARRVYAERLDRHRVQVRTRHPRLGGLILALSGEPSHVRAWQTGAVGEEAFGQRLASMASETLRVLHDRKLPRSAANIDHLAVTSEAVWVLDAKRYRGRVELRGAGIFSRRPPDLYVGGRNQRKLVEGVKKQVEVVRSMLGELVSERRLTEVPVRGGLVFVDAGFGVFPSPFAVDGVWVGWGKAIRARLVEQTRGSLPVAEIAKRLAREFRPA